MNFIFFLKKDIGKFDSKDFFNSIVIFALPNIIFLIIAYWTATSRPLINLDYLFATLMLFTGFKFIRLIGFFVLIGAIFFDSLMLLIQIFPFMDFAAIRYLSSFIGMAPNLYIWGLLGFLMLLIIIIGVISSLSKKICQRPQAIFINLILIIMSLFFMQTRITYAEFRAILGRDNYFIAHSQIRLYEEVRKDAFWSDSNVTPKIAPLRNEKNSARYYLSTTGSEKILYIIAESWGSLKNNEVNQLIVKNIMSEKNKLQFMKMGHFYTIGSTVAGELRELCSMELLNNGFAFSHLNKSDFSACLPNELVNRNYRTIALHGANGVLYDRKDWYKKAGFQNVLFGENFLGLQRCKAFNGICDEKLFNVVANQFLQSMNEKIFFYWMTLTSHSPYVEKDINNRRIDCDKFGIHRDGEMCRNIHLHAQFFDGLAKLIQKPEMKGVEVIVVGDHQPPFFTQDIKYVNPLTVSYLHFKVKAN
jgi:hypothetical protein